MRTVSIIPPGGAMAVVVYDGNKTPLPDANADGFKPVSRSLQQMQPLLRSSFQLMNPRFNLVTLWDFVVCHSFSTLIACQDFVGQRAQTLPANGELMILNKSGQGTFARYIKNVLVAAPQVQSDFGQTVFIKYQIAWASLYSNTP